MTHQRETVRPARVFDLAIAYTWEYDREFVQWIEDAAHGAGLETYLVSYHNVDETLQELRSRRLTFRYVLDRASDESELFLPFAQYLSRLSQREDLPVRTHAINPSLLLHRAADKATMHLEFLSHGINVPYTIIISPFNLRREPELSLSELAQLGRPFIIKPANTTGGGIGVVMGAESLKDVLEARQRHRNDKYLLQETIHPAEIYGRRTWFRTFYAFGKLFATWWDDRTHLYREILPEEAAVLHLDQLKSMTLEIQAVCKLDFFSSEIALTPEARFVVVDYVNEMVDMRPQSRHPDGVPDVVVRGIINALVSQLRLGADGS